MKFSIEKLIRAKLESRQMTVSDLARELGVSRVTIYNLFEGQFSRKLIQQVSEYFSIPVHLFLMDHHELQNNAGFDKMMLQAYHASAEPTKNLVCKVLGVEDPALQTPQRKPKVIVVDDIKENVELLVRSLKKDFDVFDFTDPHQALSFIKDQVVDAIITDQRMPGMTGSSLLTKIHQMDKSVIKFIVSGYTDKDGFMEAINDAHVDGFFVKPFKPLEIREKIQHFLKQ